MWMMNAGKPTQIPPLNDAMSIELGANILGEVIIFLIAAVIIVMEVGRQRHKEESKERLRKEQLDRLRDEIILIVGELGRHEDEIKRLFEIISRLETKKHAGVVEKGPSKVSSKQNPLRPQPPKSPPAAPTRFPTVNALSPMEPSSVSASSSFPDHTRPSHFVSVVPSSLSYTTCLFLNSYMHNITALTHPTDDTLAKVLLPLSRKFCDFDTIFNLVANTDVMMFDQCLFFNTLWCIVGDFLYKQNNYLMEYKSGICSRCLEK